MPAARLPLPGAHPQHHLLHAVVLDLDPVAVTAAGAVGGGPPLGHHALEAPGTRGGEDIGTPGRRRARGVAQCAP